MHILVVDDTPGLAACLGEVLKLHHDYTSVTTAETYEAGRSAALAGHVDVAILDHNLGKDSKTGSELAAELRQVAPRVKTLILTADRSPETAARALRLGADGFMTKDAIFRRLHDAVETIVAGRRFVDPAVATDLALNTVTEEPVLAGAKVLLAPAELAVLRALARGLSNEEIALERKRSVETVKAQLRTIYGKLGVSTREEAVEAARKLGLV